MPVFPSGEWIDEFCRRLAAHPDGSEVAHGLDGVYRFVIEPSGPLSDRHAYDVEIRPSGDGAGPFVRRLEGGGEPTLTLAADYDRWRQLIRGELDVGMAVMLRRLRVSGQLSRLMSRMSTTSPLIESLGAVDTQWLGR